MHVWAGVNLDVVTNLIKCFIGRKSFQRWGRCVLQYTWCVLQYTSTSWSLNSHLSLTFPWACECNISGRLAKVTKEIFGMKCTLWTWKLCYLHRSLFHFNCNIELLVLMLTYMLALCWNLIVLLSSQYMAPFSLLFHCLQRVYIPFNRFFS